MNPTEVKVKFSNCILLTVEEGMYEGEYLKLGSEWWQLYNSTWEPCYDEQPILETYLKESAKKPEFPPPREIKEDFI